jgi:hypothetical protein
MMYPRLQLGDGGSYRGKKFRCPKCGGKMYELTYIIGDSLVTCLTCKKYMSSARYEKHWIEENKDGKDD